MGAMASKKASESSPVSARSASASAGEVSGPVAMMTLSHSSGGRPAISSRAIAMLGWLAMRGFDGRGKSVAVHGERAARRQLVRVGRAQDQRSRAAHFLVQEADGVVLPIVRAERIGAHELGQPRRPVRRRHACGAHLVQHHARARVRRLPGRLAPREPAADDMNDVKRSGHTPRDTRSARAPQSGRATRRDCSRAASGLASVHR